MAEIFFVCTGNTCRSPMAATLAAAIFAREGISITVKSAGVAAASGSPASKHAIAAMQLEKLDLSGHASQAAAAEVLAKAALILTMTKAHLNRVKSIIPTANAYTLGEFADSLVEISDPFGGSLDEYKTCAAQIKTLLEACAEKFRGLV